jgi:multidrug efflux pump
LENIFRHIEEGLDPFSAAIKGAKEIGFAIVAMSMTLAAVFAPLAFTPGRTGKLFSEFALALAGAVLVSGLVALTLTPMMSSLLLRHNPNPSKFDNFMERVLVGISNGYEKLLVIVLRKLRWLVVSVMAACGVGIFLVYPTMKQELSPLEDRGTVLVTVTAPDGSTLDYTDKYAKTLEKIGSTYPEFDRIFANLGNPTVAQGSVIYRAVDWDQRKRTTLEIARELQGKFNGIAGINAFPITPPSLGQGFRERPVNFVIQTSDSYQNLNTVTRQMLDEIAKNPGFISPDVDLRLNKPELRVDVDRIKATELGVSVEVVAKAVETMLGGRVVTRYKRDAEQYDVIVQTQVSGRNTPSDIDNIYVRGRNDSVIPLSALVKVRESVSPRELNHFGQRRSVSITANLAPEYSLGEALKFLDKTAAGILKPGYTTELNGTSREFRNSQGALVIVFVLALFFIFLVLAAQFESFIDPLVIMLSVPLSMFGAIMTLKLTGGSLNVYSQIGLITLVGLITKHGILIVEFTNQLREQGVDTFDAIVKASAQRLRPILMTTGAMVLGALPLAMATGAGAESRIQIGWVIVGGMSFGTLLTVFVVPTMYTLFARKSVPGPNKADALDTPNQVGHAHL